MLIIISSKPQYIQYTGCIQVYKLAVPFKNFFSSKLRECVQKFGNKDVYDVLAMFHFKVQRNHQDSIQTLLKE